MGKRRLGRNKLIEKSLIYCIAYDRDESRSKKVVRESKKWGICPIKVIKPESGQLTKFRDHIQLLENADKRGATSCVIFEDCAHFIGPARLEEAPKDADILFLGGEVEYIFEHTGEIWKKACVSSTYAYIVMKRAYKKVIRFLRNCENGTLSDAFQYMQKLAESDSDSSSFLNSYVMYPQAVLHYKHMVMKELSDTPKNLNMVPYEWVSINDKQKYIKFNVSVGKGEKEKEKEKETSEEKPMVSIISVPSQKEWNHSLFDIMMRNFFLFNYPDDKLEWIIIDTADDDSLKDLMENICPGFLDDTRVKYKRISSTNTIELNGNQKLNEAMKIIEHTSQYAVIMSEAVYYSPDHISFCAHILDSPVAKENNISCIGRVRLGYYDLGHQYCYQKHSLDINGHDILLNEKSLAFSVPFWIERPFNDNQVGNIGYAFIMDRFDRVWNLPNEQFTMMGLSYGIRPVDKRNDRSLLSLLDNDTQEFLEVTGKTFKLN